MPKANSKPNPKLKKYEEALKDIALYVLPVYTFSEQKYVKLEHAFHLVQTAKEALEK